MLMDEMLPLYDFQERHTTIVQAPASIVLDCAARQRTQDDPLVQLAIKIRELPSRLMGRARPRSFDLTDFTFLGRDGDRSLTYGLAGAFWQVDYGLLEILTPEAFKAVDRPDICRLVMDFTVEQMSSGQVRLSTETRVHCPTAETRRKFAPYWYLIRPVSGLIRRRMLARIKQHAETAFMAKITQD